MKLLAIGSGTRNIVVFGWIDKLNRIRTDREVITNVAHRVLDAEVDIHLVSNKEPGRERRATIATVRTGSAC